MVIISDDGAHQVISQLASHGYFLSHDTRVQGGGNDNEDDDDGFESYQKWTQQYRQQQNTASNKIAFSFKDSGWPLIPAIADGNDEGCYFTPNGLICHLIHQLQHKDHSGRAFLSELCRENQVDSQVFLTKTSISMSEEDAVISSLWNKLEEKSELLSVTILGSNKSGTRQDVELVSVGYWERTLKEITVMVEEQGSVSISDLMTAYSLLRDAILNHLVVDRGRDFDSSSTGGRMRLIDDSKQLVSESYYHSLRQKVLIYFACLEEPTQINVICQEQGWDWNQVLEWLTTKLEGQEQEKRDEIDIDEKAQEIYSNTSETKNIFMEGEIHMDAATCGQTAIYLPKSYRKRQQQDVLEFIAANGYITMERAVKKYRQGLLASQITTLVLDAIPDVIVINGGNVLIRDSILQQVQAGIQDCLSPSAAESTQFLDLQEYLPVELLQSPTTVLDILEKVGFTSSSDGVAVIGNDRAIVVGKDVIQRFKDKHLSRLIQDHSKNRAIEIFHTDCALEEDNDDDDDYEGFASGRKSGKSSRSKRSKNFKLNSKKNKYPKGDTSSYVIPLSAIMSVVIDTYPTFQEEALSSDDIKASNLKWEDDDDSGSGFSLVATFCRKAFYSKSFLEQCDRAFDAELKRLEFEKNSKTKISRKDAAAKVRSVETAFQDAFVTLCYLIQAQSKPITFFANNLIDCFDEASLEKMKKEFLEGPCADLISRITQHCLFKEEAEEDCVFTFVHSTPHKEDNNNVTTDETVGEKEKISSGLPWYCSDIIITARRHPQSYLSSPPPREPLPILRECFSGNTGIVLSKMWILCGGYCYRGGVRTIEQDEGDGSTQSIHVRPGNMGVFLSYAEENCLTLCGLPYKKMDKKAEKNLLFSRKQQLNALLASTGVATDPISVLEYTIMILFQQVRSLVVSGSMLCGPILDALSRERKIPPSVAAALKLLCEMIQDDDKTIDEELVSLVKECGLVRDISKHDTTPLENFLAHL